MMKGEGTCTTFIGKDWGNFLVVLTTCCFTSPCKKNSLLDYMYIGGFLKDGGSFPYCYRNKFDEQSLYIHLVWTSSYYSNQVESEENDLDKTLFPEEPFFHNRYLSPAFASSFMSSILFL